MPLLNPVHMTEEDAADLQFPEDPNVQTKYSIQYCNVQPVSTSSEPFWNEQFCSSCRQDRGPYYIKCEKCSVILCLQCFTAEKEPGEHEKNHPHIMKDDNFIVFPGSNWTVYEEKLLLDKLVQYGNDNWEAIANFFINRTPEECKEHYKNHYFNGAFTHIRRICEQWRRRVCDKLE